MRSDLSVGQIIKLETTMEGAEHSELKFRLLPRIHVVFGSGSTNEEEPILVPSPDKAYEIIRGRHPNAFWQRWNEQYASEVNSGYLFDFWGEDGRDGLISLIFYHDQVDVIHSAMLPRESKLMFEAGVVNWFLEEIH